MKSRKDIDKELDELASVLEAWDYRQQNIFAIEESYVSNSYEELLQKSYYAISKYDIPQIEDLRSNYDSLLPNDILIAITSGAIGAITPKVTAKFLNNIHDELSHANGFLGKIFNHDGEWIDSSLRDDGRRVVKGAFHRFRPDGNHDLLNINGLLTSINQFGVLKGVIKYLMHYLLDSCSATGVPVPGTTNFLYLIREKFGMKFFGLKDQSEWVALRMGDFLQAGATSGILALYNHVNKVPKDSLRVPQMGILGHGLSLVGSTYIAVNSGNKQMLSKVSYPAAGLFLKNYWNLYTSLNKISKEIKELDNQIEELISKECFDY